MQERKKQSVLYDFLMEKKYRWTRHFLLIISIGIISTNHIFITYGEQIRGGDVCGIIFAHIVALSLQWNAAQPHNTKENRAETLITEDIFLPLSY